MTTENCVVCGGGADIHADDRRHRHVTCPTCGPYIAAEAFASRYVKMDAEVRAAFAAWMERNKHNPKRFLYINRPMKDNPYGPREGFEMLSVTRIQSRHY